jgi:hypothetical protein
VQDLDLAQAEDELYALPPDDFRAARDERAAQARAAGDKDLARAITALRRPVVSAWLVNTLARTEPGRMAELLALGESLRDAQEALDGDRLRELSVQRRQLVAGLVDAAKQVAERDGRTVSLQVEREVEATLQAALADPGAAEAVSAGRLAGPLSYAGLGAGEATPLRPVRPARPAVAHKDPAVRTRGDRTAQPDVAARRAARESGQRETREAAAAERKEREAAAARSAAERAVQDAAGAADAARGALDDAEQTVTSARAAQEAVRRRAEQLDRELTEALAEQSRATRAVRDAQRSRDTAARALDAAAKRLARARQAASRLGAAPASDAAAAGDNDAATDPA